MRYGAVLAFAAMLCGCQRLEDVGKAPAFTPVEAGGEYYAMTTPGLPEVQPQGYSGDEASLWTGGRGSLLGDRRAGQRGDILTVVIEIDDKAEISNTTGRSRSGSDRMGIPNLLGIPQRIDGNMPAGASLADAFGTNSSSDYQGNGSDARK